MIQINGKFLKYLDQKWEKFSKKILITVECIIKILEERNLIINY